MAKPDEIFCFDQLHIDVARNTTDDFNPFHDPQRWRQIEANPFGSTIALGFQTEFLVSHLIEQGRRSSGEAGRRDACGLRFGNYEFMFAGALKPGEPFGVDIRKTVDKTADGGGLSNRIIVRKREGELVLMGKQSETAAPRFLPDLDIADLPPLRSLTDRSMVKATPYFLKRKFLNTSNGKNFVLAGLADQHDYFDELAERVMFPPIFTAAMISCALLEKGRLARYDFAADPMVYTSHQISVDREAQAGLRSNMVLHLLVEGPLSAPPAKGLGRVAVEQQKYRCLGIVDDRTVLFRANVQMAPLHALLD